MPLDQVFWNNIARIIFTDSICNYPFHLKCNNNPINNTTHNQEQSNENITMNESQPDCSVL